jgi:pimeloyl-ACP methyl ester carboxylesterase
MRGSGILPLNGTDLSYTVQGPEDGIPVLLIHGWTCDMTDWAFQIAFLLLFQTLRVITLDLRGHGRSFAAPSTTAFDPIAMASDAAALLHHLGVSAERQAIVMGHSLGGSVVTELVSSYPELIRGHVLVDPSYILGPDAASLIPALEEDFDGMIADYFVAAYTPGTPSFIIDWHQLRAWTADEDTMIAVFAQLIEYQGPSGAEFLKTKKVAGIPRLVTMAAPASLEIEEEAGIDEKFDHVELIEVGHWIMQTGSEHFNTVLGNWLKQWGWVPGNSTIVAH